MALLTQLKLLVNLARIDGSIAEREKNYIVNIAKANGFPESSAATLFYQSHDNIVLDNLSDDQKFEYIYSLVQLMKIDERLYREEIKFCSRIGTRLGYEQDVMFELMLKVKSPIDEHERNVLKENIQKYLKKG
jgi:uncharacterized tellurite resistance protein B-like protein